MEQLAHVTDTNTGASAATEANTEQLDIDQYHHSLDCPHAELLKFWKPPTVADLKYKSPFADHGPKVKYVTFEPGKMAHGGIDMCRLLSCVTSVLEYKMYSVDGAFFGFTHFD